MDGLETARSRREIRWTPLRRSRTLGRMWTGDVIADRFELGRPLGSGGEGTVFLSTDRLGGSRVAVKVLERESEGATDRLRREARVLAGLTHPGIVRYVAHGEARNGRPFLVMEWLEGENLAQRLQRGSLEVEEAIGLARLVATALGFAHERGVVHRDIKPSNLFLIDGRADHVKVLDFGLARPQNVSQAITHPGTMLGTIGYMAPEQVMGDRVVDARADIFGLGCVLYECLTGRAPFAGEHGIAVLAKLLRADPPRVSELRAELGDWLDSVVARMMAKGVAERPADATQLLKELDAAAERPRDKVRTPSPRTPSITHAEQRVVSVILVATDRERPDSSTMPSSLPVGKGERVRAIAAQFGAEAMALKTSTWLILLSGKGLVTDRATRAGACALSLHRDQHQARIAVATGRADTTGRLPVGPAIDRAAALLHAPHEDTAFAGVSIDEGTARLLGPHFDVRQSGDVNILYSERQNVNEPRLLLGKLTPCVGRQKELAILDAILEECSSERLARAALVTGAPGIGKSRLCAEFLSSSAQRRKVAVLTVRANQTQAGSSFALIKELVRTAAHLSSRESHEEQHARLRGRLAGRLNGEDLERCTEFIAELVDVMPEARVSPLLRAARDDARIMSGWVRRAFEEWLLAECAWAPLVIALEDLHWADAASITFLTGAFRKVEDAPLLLVGFARPEVHEQLPEFEAVLKPQEIVLAGLTRRPAQQLVELVLGKEAAREVAERIVTQADGNAFYLEELIRAVAEGRHGTLPETVVAMAQARLDSLPSEARRILRAASVLGDVFSKAGVAALLGNAFGQPEFDEWFETLSELELLAPAPAGKLLRENVYTFRHALLREAAYAMLTDADREHGHRLAAACLAEESHTDALVIADHFERGGRPREALPWLLKAAETALNAGNNVLAISMAERGLQVADEELRGRFLETQQIALAFRGEWSAAFNAAEGAMALLPAGSTPWFRSAGTFVMCAIYLGRPAAVMEVMRIGASLPAPNPTGPFGLAMHMIVASLLHAGARAAALPFAARIDGVVNEGQQLDPVFIGWRHTVTATLELFLHDRIAPAIRRTGEALESFDAAADFVGWSMASLYKGIALVEAGAFEQAREQLRPVAERTEAMLLPAVDYARYYLARMDAVSGVLTSAEALLGSPPGIADGARGFLAEAHFRNGDLELARREALAIASSASCYARATGLSILGRIELARGNSPGALRFLDQAIAAQDTGSVVPFWRSVLLLARVDALFADGQHAAGREALDRARARIMAVSAEFDDETLRHSYLALPVHAETLARTASG